MDDRICPECGAAVPPAGNFCTVCGAAVEQELQEQLTQQHAALSFDPAEPPVLVVVRGENAGSRFALSADRVRIGRHPDSDIFLDDVTVSRRHAEILSDATGYHVKDVGSLNGTYVNGERIERAALRDSDQIQVGKYRFVVIGATDGSA
jgi:pSer/pThr/pTyr-binding forkhead associated (FHA) protein